MWLNSDSFARVRFAGSPGVSDNLIGRPTFCPGTSHCELRAKPHYETSSRHFSNSIGAGGKASIRAHRGTKKSLAPDENSLLKSARAFADDWLIETFVTYEKTTVKEGNPGRTVKPGPRPDSEAEEAFPPSPADPSAGWLEGGLALLDSSRRVTFANEELAKWLCPDGSPLAGNLFDDLLQSRCPGSEPVLARAWAEPAQSGRYEISLPDQGEWLCLETVRAESGWFVRLSSILPSPHELLEHGGHGLTGEDPEKKQLRLRLLRAESQLDKLIERWPGVVFSQRADFSFQFVSAKIEELTGVPPDLWRNQPRRFWDVVHEADVEELKRQCQQAVRIHAGVTSTYRIRHAVTGRVSYILEHRQAAVSKSGMVLGYEGFWLDVTRQTIAEKRLSTAAWKETLALLTMGLAHDFSNLMSGILSLTELTVSQLGPEHASAPTLNMIRQSSLQASQIVQRIVSLHRSKTGTRQYLDLGQIVPELVELVTKVLPRRIRVQTELPGGQLPVYLDAVEFRQVVLNLALNAADAMPNRGALAFRVVVHTTPQELKHFQGKFPRLPCFCLSVEDNGSGIAPRHLAQLFDPFFTTKPLTKGSGLGLYNARIFVEEHGGAISVESKEGVGSMFHIWLPQADFTEAERMAAQNAERRRSMLLVGNPGLPMDAVAEFLRTHNFYVVATHTPQRAIELLATEENNLHGVMVLADPADANLLNLVAVLHDGSTNRRVILQLIGSNADRVDNRILEKASLVLSSDAPEKVILQKLNDLFSSPQTT